MPLSIWGRGEEGGGVSTGAFKQTSSVFFLDTFAALIYEILINIMRGDELLFNLKLDELVLLHLHQLVDVHQRRRF